jgi:outer membrane receptor protein involved in Fe transport
LLVKPLARLSVVLLVMIFAAAAFAGTTGKIAGTITDEQTGEPLPGANVMIAGTNIGAATNVQGEFFIINVPPGNYNLKVNLIGYRPLEVKSVVVTLDLTTTLDLELQTETIDMGTITVEAERPLIEKDVTSTRMRLTPEEITNSAVSGLVNRVAFNAGNVLGSFRGSREGTGEVVYLLDGVNMANPLGTFTGITPGSGPSTALAAYIPDEAVAEAEVLTGGFGAEYPSVQSAVINVVAKEGSKTLSGKLKSQSSVDAVFGWDVFGNRTYNSTGAPTSFVPVRDADGNIVSWDWTGDPTIDEYRRSKVRDYRKHDWSLSGPVPLNSLDIPGEMTFSTTGMYEFERDFRNPKWWQKNQSIEGKIGYNLSSSKKLTVSGLHSSSDYIPYDFYRSAVISWGQTYYFSGPVYHVGTGDMYFRPQSVPEGQEQYYVLTPDGLDSIYSFTPYGWIVSDGHNYVDADTTFFNILNGLLGLNSDNEDYFTDYPDGEFQDVDINGISLLNAVGMATDSVEALGIARTYTNYDMWQSQFRAEGFSNKIGLNFTNNLSPRSFYTLVFSRFHTEKRSRTYDPWDGHPLTYDEMNTARFISMGATQTQNFFINPMYLGRRRTGDDYQTVYTLKGDFSSQINAMNLMKMGFEYQKYDLFKDHTSIASGGNDYNDQFHVKPFQIGAYAQNKLESEGMILNVGLRYDFFDPKTWVPANLNDPLLDQYRDDPQDVETIFDLPERLKGAVSATTKQQLSPRVGVSYPITEKDVLHVTYGHYFQLPKLFYLYMNQAYDLRGAHKYMGNPDLKEEKTIAYEAGLEHGFNDYLKLAVTGFYKDISNLVTFHKTYYGNAFFWLYSNSDYARVKGFELTLTQRPWRGLSGVATYTYQIARGRASDGYQTFLDHYYNRKPRTQDFPLDWDQRHTARVEVNYRVPYDWGPKIGDYYAFGDWAVDVFWNYGSGVPYTSSINVPQPEIPPINDKNFPAAWTIDLRIDKAFKIYKTYRANFFFIVNNLTNRANIVDEYADFDAQRYDLTGEPGGQFADPDAYDAPRRIYLGAEFLF